MCTPHEFHLITYSSWKLSYQVVPLKLVHRKRNHSPFRVSIEIKKIHIIEFGKQSGFKKNCRNIFWVQKYKPAQPSSKRVHEQRFAILLLTNSQFKFQISFLYNLLKLGVRLAGWSKSKPSNQASAGLSPTHCKYLIG